MLSCCDIKGCVIHWEHYLYPLLKWQLIVDDKGMPCVSRILYLHMKETCKRMLTINTWPNTQHIDVIDAYKLFCLVLLVCALAFLTRSRKIIYHFSAFYGNFSFIFFSIFSITFWSLRFLSQESYKYQYWFNSFFSHHRNILFNCSYWPFAQYLLLHDQ